MRNAAQASEELLARLFTDAEFRARFKQDPQGIGRESGLDDAATAALAHTDWVGLDLAARSYAKKRETYAGRKRRWWPIKKESILKTLFFNANGQLRNGWWICIFIAFIAITSVAYKPLSHGLKDLGLPKLWLEPAPFLLALLATWACTRLRKEPLASVGFQLDRRWFREMALGTLSGIAMLLAVVGLICLIGGVRFELDPARTVGTLLTGLYFFLFVSLLEETLFRGFIFQRLLDGIGIWPAQIAMAALFAAAHWGAPGMQGTTEIVAVMDLFLSALMLGLAYLRTRSLALPVGLHLGWNWTQGHVMGFGVSGYDFAGWWHPLFQGKAEWLTGGAFGPESSIFSPVVSLVMIILLWRWKGSVPSPQQPS